MAAPGAISWPTRTVWHKIDLVRVRDRKAPGGWRYYAHLLVHQGGYQSPSTLARRAQIPAGRRAGVDANVSNLAVASFPDEHPEQLAVEQITCDAAQQRAAARAARRARASAERVGSVAAQHQRRPVRPVGAAAASARNAAPRTGCRSARSPTPVGRGMPAPMGCRCALTATTRSPRDIGAPAVITPPNPARASQAKQARAAQVAARIVAAHGNSITVEDCRISTWARLWGKRIALFSPGMLVAALKRECHAAGGRFYRAGTRATAMSQHCLCGARVPKTLAQRTHDCPQCGLHGDRDIVSAALAACVDSRRSRRSAHRAGRLPTCPRPARWVGLPARVGGFSQPAPATTTI